ncbi:galectin-7 [Amia ocellicauda]|uniref:galectin-7 n=1 Tax=Amia ocellicauda TaxID=2972642 RepID=UPI0034644177|nr:LEG7 protein [Amia calva]
MDLTVPYLGPLSLSPGMSVSISGVIDNNCTRFAVNLQCGDSEDSDIALHVNPRFDDNDIVFNTLRDGYWEEEDVVPEVPFTKGESFQLIITASAEAFEINVNGNQIHTFQQRMPLERVSAIRVIGDVTLETLNINEN